MQIPHYLRRTYEYQTPKPQREQRRLFEQWRRKQARREWRRYVGRFTSADAWKDDPYNKHRYRNIYAHGADLARKAGYGEALSQKKASIRRRWRLPEHADIRA